ncbi:glycerol kinase [Alteromonas sediminis]|uniref:Glycerol kinase n=1 Tax=Alteromonas sediminis TaxID=2259342 RepID=A0A3N5YQ37_9ALTE|nr:glycerol kinase GlpK [Alteromonas sediminis]RPJ68101.1 glycerol kinase [Alteromonas sediminis]
MSFILAIDQGTTSTRAIIFSSKGEPLHTAQQEFPQAFPCDGWVEHDPEQIWQSVLNTCREVLAKSGISANQINTLGITNQRETTVIWDKSTSVPIYPAIVWQDRRTAPYCESLSQDAELDEYLRQKTGLLLDPYFSATKIKWILDNVTDARTRAENGGLAFGTIDTYLIWKLTGGRCHYTDATNASRTLLFDLEKQQWDPHLLETFSVPQTLLPEVKDSADEFGLVDPTLLGAPIPIQAVAGDQQAALFGQTCFEKGMAKSTYGTGCFMMLNTGETPLRSNHKLLTTVAYRLNGQPTYALEGSIFMAGATVQWLRDGLQLISHASESEALAKKASKNNGVFLVPAFTGLGAPYWDPDARGAIMGLTRDTGIAEIVAAGLQSVCYQTKDLQKAMESDGARPITLRVDGGMSNNDWVMAYLADVLGAQVDRPKITETTALGVAYLAGLQAGIFENFSALTSLWKIDKSFTPKLTKAERDAAYSGWCQAVERVRQH